MAEVNELSVELSTPIDPAPVQERLANIQQDSGAAGLTTQATTPELLSNQLPASQISVHFLEGGTGEDRLSAQQLTQQPLERKTSQKPHGRRSYGSINAIFGAQEEVDKDKDIPIVNSNTASPENPHVGKPPSEADAKRRANVPTSKGVSYKDFYSSKPDCSSSKASAPLRTLSELTNGKYVAAADVGKAKKEVGLRDLKQSPDDELSSRATHGQCETGESKRGMASSKPTEGNVTEKKTTITIIEPCRSKACGSSEFVDQGDWKIEGSRDTIEHTEDLKPHEGKMSSSSTPAAQITDRSHCSEDGGDAEKTLKFVCQDAPSMMKLTREITSTITKRRWYGKDLLPPHAVSESEVASKDNFNPEIHPYLQCLKYDDVLDVSEPSSVVTGMPATDTTAQAASKGIGLPDTTSTSSPESCHPRSVVYSPGSTEAATDSFPTKKIKTFSLPFDKRARSLFRRLNSDEDTTVLRKHQSHFGNLAAMRRDRPSIEQQIRNRTQRTAERMRRRFSFSAEASASRPPLIGVNVNSRTRNVEIRAPIPQPVDSEHRRLLSPSSGSRFGEHVDTIAHQGMNVDSHVSSERSSGTEIETQGDLFTEYHGEADSAHSVAPPLTRERQDFEAEEGQDFWRLNEQRMQRINETHPVPFGDIPSPPFAPRASLHCKPESDFLAFRAAGASTVTRINASSSHDAEGSYRLPEGTVINDHHLSSRSQFPRHSNFSAGRSTKACSPVSRTSPPTTLSPTESGDLLSSSAANHERRASSVSAFCNVNSGSPTLPGRPLDWTTPLILYRQSDTRALPAELSGDVILPRAENTTSTQVESSVNRDTSVHSDEQFSNITDLARQAKLSVSPTSPVSPSTLPEYVPGAVHIETSQSLVEVHFPDLPQSNGQPGLSTSSASPVSPDATVAPFQVTSGTRIADDQESNERGYVQVAGSLLDIRKAVQNATNLDDIITSEFLHSADCSSDGLSAPSADAFYPICEAPRPPNLPPNVEEPAQASLLSSPRADGATTQIFPDEAGNTCDGLRRDTAHQ